MAAVEAAHRQLLATAVLAMVVGIDFAHTDDSTAAVEIEKAHTVAVLGRTARLLGSPVGRYIMIGSRTQVVARCCILRGSLCLGILVRRRVATRSTVRRSRCGLLPSGALAPGSSV